MLLGRWRVRVATYRASGRTPTKDFLALSSTVSSCVIRIVIAAKLWEIFQEYKERVLTRDRSQ